MEKNKRRQLHCSLLLLSRSERAYRLRGFQAQMRREPHIGGVGGGGVGRRGVRETGATRFTSLLLRTSVLYHRSFLRLSALSGCF